MEPTNRMARAIVLANPAPYAAEKSSPHWRGMEPPLTERQITFVGSRSSAASSLLKSIFAEIRPHPASVFE